MSEARRPLDGLRVLDLSTMIAGPFCASLLGEFGAEVIKVEEPGAGDPFRRFGTMTAAGCTLNFLNEARNKKSVCIDLRAAQGIAIFKQLLPHVDVVVENFRPGTMEKWGLGYETLQEIRPDIVMTRISAYGQTGPDREKPGYARVAHAYAGLSILAGEPGGTPVVPGSTSLGDYIAGLHAAVGTLMALFARNRWGFGQAIDVALSEGIFRTLDELAPAYARDGYVRERMGADTVNAVPHSHYRTSDDRWLALACSSDKMFARMANAMEMPELLERFAAVEARVRHRQEINELVSGWIGARSLADTVQILDRAGVPCGPLNTIADIFEDPHFKARGALVTMQHPLEGSVVIPGVVARLSRTPGRVTSLGPALGEHTEDVLQELAGIGSDELRQLKKDAVI